MVEGGRSGGGGGERTAEFRGNGGEEVDIVVRMEAANVGCFGGERTADFHTTVERVVDYEVVRHTDAVGLHGVALAVVVIADCGFVEVGHSSLFCVCCRGGWK